jgi:hypothetical protein
MKSLLGAESMPSSGDSGDQTLNAPRRWRNIIEERKNAFERCQQNSRIFRRQPIASRPRTGSPNTPQPKLILSTNFTALDGCAFFRQDSQDEQDEQDERTSFVRTILLILLIVTTKLVNRQE